eukprot:m.7723 g.7723  ORF g.7723 m.7723 type:complete len:90 (-) comp3762_c0_seq1:82-351(-)
MIQLQNKLSNAPVIHVQQQDHSKCCVDLNKDLLYLAPGTTSANVSLISFYCFESQKIFSFKEQNIHMHVKVTVATYNIVKVSAYKYKSF